MPDLEAPTAPGPLQREPITILTIVLVIAQALVTFLGAGDLKDGFQLGDIIVLVSTILTGLIARLSVFSQATVDLIEPSRRAQQRAVKEAKRR
jgi:uncharacterized membrane protein